MTISIIQGDCRSVLEFMPSGSVHCCVTSPPYFGLRDYGVEGQIGLEQTPSAYVAEMVAVFREVKRVLRDDGTLWLNLGDSYASTGGHGGIGANSQRAGRANVAVQNARKGYAGGNGIKIKDLIGIPWRVAFALQADGWYLRQDIIWHKPNPMPESVRDRCTKAHEYIFLLSKNERYYFDEASIKEPAIGGQTGKAASFKREGSKRGQTIPGQAYGAHRPDRPDVAYNGELRNRRSVWTVATKPFREAHFATFPPDLIEPCVLAGCPAGGVVLDPFNGAGTTGLVAQRHGRGYVGIELNPDYVRITKRRLGLSDPTTNTGIFA